MDDFRTQLVNQSSKNASVWNFGAFLRIFFLFFITAIIYLQADRITSKHDESSISMVNELVLDFKRGSEETQRWLREYADKLDATVMEKMRSGRFAPERMIGYFDVSKRTQGWSARANDPHFTYFYARDVNGNIQAGVGTYWFTSEELMSVVTRDDKRDFEEEILNKEYCLHRSDRQKHVRWKYVEDVFSHSVFYMVGMHKFPTVEAKNVTELLIPFIINSVNQLLPHDSIWEFWVPGPLGPMPGKLKRLGFKGIENGYVQNDIDLSENWMYNPTDFAEAFDHFIWHKLLGGYPLVALNSFSHVLLGRKGAGPSSFADVRPFRTFPQHHISPARQNLVGLLPGGSSSSSSSSDSDHPH